MGQPEERAAASCLGAGQSGSAISEGLRRTSRSSSSAHSVGMPPTKSLFSAFGSTPLTIVDPPCAS
jgi:hypothetical protein